MSGRYRRNPLATYLFVGTVMGAICGGLIGLCIYDDATSLFHGGGIGMFLGAVLGALLPNTRD